MKLIFTGANITASLTNGAGETLYNFTLSDANVEMDLLKLKHEIDIFFGMVEPTFTTFDSFTEAVYAFYADGGHTKERTDELLNKYPIEDLHLLHAQINSEGYHCPAPTHRWNESIPA